MQARCGLGRRRAALWLGGLLVAACGAHAQTAPLAVSLDAVVVSGQRAREPSFNVPAAISAVGRDEIENAGPQIGLNEVLSRLPGISVRNRNNEAQDLQLSIRGFGARSTFGIRGVKVLVDGIPATMPDGQGQLSNVALGSVGRIEVLRGPLAQLYGNAAGGVLQVFTADDALVPTATLSAALGRYGLWKVGTTVSTSTPGYGLTIEGADIHSDGFRPHSQSRRRQLNARWQSQWTANTHVAVVLNVLDQPTSKDPLGLTAEQFRSRRTGSNPAYLAALAQDPRKTVRQQQLGATVTQRVSDVTELSARWYLGSRELTNALSIPIAAQASPTSSGGIVDFDRTYGGAAVQGAHRIALAEGRELTLTAGIEVETYREDRQGYVNTRGERGDLKRDELNTVRSTDVFVQANYDLTPQWTLTAGARHSRVTFTSDDRYIAPGNPDDSGRLAFSATNPVAGIAWKATPTLNAYANIGRGFETPTFNELSYRPDGSSGLNTALKASRSRHTEVGVKWKVTHTQRLDAALFYIATDDELVVNSSMGGRSTFKNAGRTSRRGIELSHTAQLGRSLHSVVSLSTLRARFDDAFVSGSGSSAAPVRAGNRLPGTPNRQLYAELAWSPGDAFGGLGAAVEAAHSGRLYVNDTNSDPSSTSTVFNLRVNWRQTVGGWQFNERVRIDNLTDRAYVGSVIVNEGNGRYFEPARPRAWTIGITATHAWQ